jgi:hypothetical protein
MDEKYALERDNYKDYGGYFGSDKFFSDGEYGVVSETFGINKEDYT